MEGNPIAAIGRGLVVFLGIGGGDGEEEAQYIAAKVANIRIFDDAEGKFDGSALDTSAELLVVSQFTLYGSTRKGRRPSFTQAAPPEQAEPLVDRTVELLREAGLERGHRPVPGAHARLTRERRPRHHHARLRGPQAPPPRLLDGLAGPTRLRPPPRTSPPRNAARPRCR